MAKVNNPALGIIACRDCDGVATVHQTSRGAGRFLYTRCTDCGPDQRTGAKVQTRLWHGTQWEAGQPDIKPPNVVDDFSEKEPANGLDSSMDFEPEPDDESSGEPSKAGDWPWLLGGLGLVALALGGR